MEVDRIWALCLMAILLLLALLRRKKEFLVVPSLRTIPSSGSARLASMLSSGAPIFLLLLLGVLAAGLRLPNREYTQYAYGEDIVFILDESGSMGLPFDLSSWTGEMPDSQTPVKISAAKAAISKFIEKRTTGQDRYGLTAFGTSAIRLVPLTFNHDLLLASLEAQTAILGTTNIEIAVASALDELMHSTARTRVMVFVSDGGGQIKDDQYHFSDFLKQYGIRFYWVALGTEMVTDLPQFLERIGPLGRRIDVSDAVALQAGFAEIHNLERSLMIRTASSPAISFPPLIYGALGLMALIWASTSLFVYRHSEEIPV